MRLYIDLDLGTLKEFHRVVAEKGDQMVVETTAVTAVCTRRLSLLDRWLSLSEEYSRAVAATIRSKSEMDRAFFLAVIEDVKTQMNTAMQELEVHRMTHGC